MSRWQRMQYRGAARDIQYSPWVRLIHGRHYEVKADQLRSGKVRCKIKENDIVVKAFYKDEFAFSREWC